LGDTFLRGTGFIFIVVVVALVGCGGDDKSAGEKACDKLEEKAAECHLTTGKCNTNNTCAVECAVAADCAALTKMPEGSLLECLAACSGTTSDDFICKDGSGYVAKLGVCDGRYQCPDGSDEANCGDAGP
jgi:hypothetical protein